MLKILIPTVILLIPTFLIAWKIILPRIIPPPYKMDKFTIKELKGDERPFVWDKIAPLEPDFPSDSEGIILYGDQYYNPVSIANTGLYYLDSYKKTNNVEYLNMTTKYANKLTELSYQDKEAIYFPYNFNFEMHGLKNDVMMAPWYSGMAQGEALSLFVRLYEFTNNKEYLKTANKIFKSFTYLGNNNSPWTVYVDDEKYYWIEEYPSEDPDHTLNGFIFSLYGVYDYYSLTKDKQSKEILDASLTTLKRYLPDFEKKGDKSFYCLKHQKQDSFYHKKHIEQLNMLYKMTGDEYFKMMADNFYRDFH